MRNFVDSIAEEYGNRTEPPEIFRSLTTKPSMEELFGSARSTPTSMTPMTLREEESYTPHFLHSGMSTPSEDAAKPGGEEDLLSPVSEDTVDEQSDNSERSAKKKDRRSRKQSEIKVATKFIWSGPANESVFLVGSFTNWQERIPLERNGEVFLTTILLEPGLYQFKYLVDGRWMYDGRRRTEADESGIVNNVISVGLKPAKFVWRGGGREVGVTGSFCGWKHVISLFPCGEERKVTIMIPPGDYDYKLIVDGVWLCDSSVPQRRDTNGNINNVLRV